MSDDELYDRPTATSGSAAEPFEALVGTDQRLRAAQERLEVVKEMNDAATARALATIERSLDVVASSELMRRLAARRAELR